MTTSKITINPGSLDPYGHLSWLVESLSRDSVLGRNWTILMPAHKILKNCPPFFIFKNSERVLRIDIGRWKFQKFIITYLSLPRKNLKTQLQLLLPLNFAYAKKLLVKRAIFVLLFEGTNFIQKLIFISKNWPRLMKISESHKDISELVWKKFGWWHLIPSWPEFCVLLFFTLVFGCFVTLDLGVTPNNCSGIVLCSQQCSPWTPYRGEIEFPEMVLKTFIAKCSQALVSSINHYKSNIIKGVRRQNPTRTPGGVTNVQPPVPRGTTCHLIAWRSWRTPNCLHMLQKFHIVNVKIQQLAIVNKYLLKWRQIYNLLTNIILVLLYVTNSTTIKFRNLSNVDTMVISSIDVIFSNKFVLETDAEFNGPIVADEVVVINKTTLTAKYVNKSDPLKYVGFQVKDISDIVPIANKEEICMCSHTKVD